MQEEADRLSSSFSVEELEQALKQSPSDKEPGLDGFSMGALKKMWSFIRTELSACLLKFQKHGTLPGGMNSSFICLIPKCDSRNT